MSDKTYITLLRGVNVSGKNLIKMSELKNVLSEAGMKNVQTYIQSGNIVFDSTEEDIDVIEKKMSEAINQSFQIEVPVLAIDSHRLARIIDHQPFSDPDKFDVKYLHVTILQNIPESKTLDIIRDKVGDNEQIFLDESTIYLYCPNGYGTTKLNNNFLEKAFGVSATTRNWKTILALDKMAKNQ